LFSLKPIPFPINLFCAQKYEKLEIKNNTKKNLFNNTGFFCLFTSLMSPTFRREVADLLGTIFRKNEDPEALFLTQ
jgi:hypothetical protein